MPILEGVNITRGEATRTFTRGVYVVSEGDASRVQKLFVDSARFKGFKPPKDLTMSAGEIFYEGGDIAEVRLRGNLPLVKDKKFADLELLKDEEWVETIKIKYEKWTKFPIIGDEEWLWKVPSWTTGGGPDFSWFDDLRLAFSPRNLDRQYVAALRIEGGLLLWWDVASARTPHTPADADVRLIQITQPIRVDDGKEEQADIESAIRYADALTHSADAMKTLLSQLRDGDELDFIDERRAFGHAFRCLLMQQFDDGSPDSTGQLSFSMNEMGEAEMRKRLLIAVAAISNDYLLIRRGRPPESETETQKPKSKKKEPTPEQKAARKQLILDAIMAEYQKFREDSPPADAECQVNGKIVYEGLDISRDTFYKWLAEIKCTFEELKTEVMHSTKD